MNAGVDNTAPVERTPLKRVQGDDPAESVPKQRKLAFLPRTPPRSSADEPIVPSPAIVGTANSAGENNNIQSSAGNAQLEREQRRAAEKALKDAAKEEEKARKALQREQEKARKEAERQLERKQKESARELERIRKDALREEVRARKEQERARKDAEREQERARKEAEKEAKREELKAKKEAEREAKRLAKESKTSKIEPPNQKGIGSFFSVKRVETSLGDQDTPLQTEYQKFFLPYHMKTSSMVYRPSLELNTPDDTIQWLQSFRKNRFIRGMPAREICKQINDSRDEGQATELLSKLNVRHIQFAENLRPPYVGTGPDVSTEKLLELAVNPHERLLSDVNYDYDSDFEWVHEEDDGEDVNDEENSEEEDDDGDMEEFLLSDDDSGKHIQIVGPLVPIICTNDGTTGRFDNLKFEALVSHPIDPFRNYWQNNDAGTTKPQTKDPLTPADSLLSHTDTKALKELLIKIQGRQCNQTLLVELLKQELPELSKAVILTAVRTYAKRRAGKEGEKRWVLDPSACERFGISA